CWVQISAVSRTRLASAVFIVLSCGRAPREALPFWAWGLSLLAPLRVPPGRSSGCRAGSAILGGRRRLAREPFRFIVTQPPGGPGGAQVGGRRRVESKGRTRDRMREREPQRVQRLSRQARGGGAAVERVAHQGMPHVGGMYPDLVRAPGLQRAEQ